MGQIGYPLPCQFASLSIRDNLLTHFGKGDDLEANYSGLVKELHELNHCLHMAGKGSLVIIDEICCGTSVTDGLALSTAILEEFIKSRCFMYVSTHFERMLRYLTSIPNVNSLNLGARQSDEGGFRFSYKIGQGLCGVKNYGIMIARQCGISEAVLAIAESIKDQFEANCDEGGSESARMLTRKIMKRKLLIETAEKIKRVDGDPEATGLIKAEFFAGLDAINDD